MVRLSYSAALRSHCRDGRVALWEQSFAGSLIITVSEHGMTTHQVPGILFHAGLSSPNTLSLVLTFEISRSAADC